MSWRKPGSLILLTILALFIILPGTAQAFRINHARAIGFGGSLGTTPRGVEVVGWNPAFLGLQDNPRMSFNTPLVNVGFRISNDAFSINELEQYFQDGKLLASSDKQAILDEIGGDAFELRGGANAMIGGVSFPTNQVNMAVTIDMIATGDAEIDKDFLEFALYGYTLDDVGVEKAFHEMLLEGVVLTRLGLTFAKQFQEFEILDAEWLDELSAGISFYYNYGLEYGSMDHFDGSYYVQEDPDGNIMRMNGLVQLISPDFGKGSGVGLDMGVAAKVLNRRGVVGLSLLNIVGTVNWTNIERRVYGLSVDEAPPLEGLDDFNDWFDENFEPLDTLTSADDHSQQLPKYILLTGGWWLQEDWLITGTYRQGLNRVAGGTTIPRLSVGTEYMVHPMVPIRCGLGVGGRSGINWGIGSGIRYRCWQSDIGIGYEKGIFNSASGMSFGISTTFFFDAPPTDPFKTNTYWQREAEQSGK